MSANQNLKFLAYMLANDGGCMRGAAALKLTKDTRRDINAIKSSTKHDTASMPASGFLEIALQKNFDSQIGKIAKLDETGGSANGSANGIVVWKAQKVAPLFMRTFEKLPPLQKDDLIRIKAQMEDGGILVDVMDKDNFGKDLGTGIIPHHIFLNAKWSFLADEKLLDSLNAKLSLKFKLPDDQPLVLTLHSEVDSMDLTFTTMSGEQAAHISRSPADHEMTVGKLFDSVSTETKKHVKLIKIILPCGRAMNNLEDAGTLVRDFLSASGPKQLVVDETPNL